MINEEIFSVPKKGLYLFGFSDNNLKILTDLESGNTIRTFEREFLFPLSNFLQLSSVTKPEVSFLEGELKLNEKTIWKHLASWDGVLQNTVDGALPIQYCRIFSIAVNRLIWVRSSEKAEIALPNGSLLLERDSSVFVESPLTFRSFIPAQVLIKDYGTNPLQSASQISEISLASPALWA